METYRPQIILACVLAYFVICIFVGLWAMRRTHSSRDFFMAGRTLGFIESPLDSFGPSFFDQGDAALLDPDALRTRDVDPLAPPSFPAPSRETRAWLREKRAEATR